MKMPDKIARSLIAHCGFNCNTCVAYLRERNKCHGCNNNDENKPHHCTKCAIKFCEVRLANNYEYCYQCQKKCQRIKQLDKRYIKNYDVSLLENLEQIKNDSIDGFLVNETKKWTCQECGGIICQHTKKCSECQKSFK